jgi:hypothetical protein
MAETGDIAAAVAKIVADGRAEFPAFDDDAQAIQDVAGRQFPAIREALAQVPQAHRVVRHLADDLGTVERLATLPPAAIGAEIGRIAARTAAPAQKPSLAPPPARPTAADPGLPMADYVKLRNEAYAKHIARRRVR